ncbi:MAG: sugar phosphate isomerase/epimerase family protein [Bacteroidota bacterium]
MLNRRFILKSLALMPVLPALSFAKSEENGCSKLKTSLNSFSFDGPLKAGKINLFQVIDYCHEHNFDAVDITGYYFPGYPNVPNDDYLYDLKRKAIQLGLEISGTGIRTDFATTDVAKRKEQIQLVKNWIEVAQKLGAPVIRIFTGGATPQGHTWEQCANWIIEDIKECVDFGKNHGVIVAIQNHNDFIKTPAHLHYFFEKINDPWFGLIMDTGGFRGGETYNDTEETIKYAVNWQIKEKIFVDNVEMDTDIKRLIQIIKNSCYKGYIPIETLGAGDPHPKIQKLMSEIRKYL